MMMMMMMYNTFILFFLGYYIVGEERRDNNKEDGNLIRIPTLDLYTDCITSYSFCGLERGLSEIKGPEQSSFSLIPRPPHNGPSSPDWTKCPKGLPARGTRLRLQRASFQPDHALSDVRLSNLVPADDVRDKFRQASNKLRTGRKIVFYAVIFMIIGSQLATIPMRTARPQSSRCNSCDFNENESGCTNCYLVCCPKSNEITPKTITLKLALRILRKSRSTRIL